MKKAIRAILSSAALFILAVGLMVSTPEAAAQTSVPDWAQESIDKISKAVPDLTEDQKTQIVEAIKTRAEAVKEAEDSGSEDQIKEQTMQAWTVYVHGMQEILSEEQFAKFNEDRLKEAGSAEQ